jgi:hypothetical protein
LPDEEEKEGTQRLMNKEIKRKSKGKAEAKIDLSNCCTLEDSHVFLRLLLNAALIHAQSLPSRSSHPLIQLHYMYTLPTYRPPTVWLLGKTSRPKTPLL